LEKAIGWQETTALYTLTNLKGNSPVTLITFLRHVHTDIPAKSTGY